MKKSTMTGILVGLLLLCAACQKMERVPSEKDGEQVWRSVQQPQLADMAELVDFKKVNGSRAPILGVDSYTLYYSAQIRYTRKVVFGPAGTLKTLNGEFVFRKTEKGWLGPDNQVY